eukprot:XP_011674508.1 PREDICTED: transcription initiation factor TFIID subunit 1 [Strongylocentrotus purpuratus]
MTTKHSRWSSGGPAGLPDSEGRPKQSKNRRRADPQVIMSGILEEILNAIRELPYTQPFHTAVEKRKFPDYYKIVSKPIALQTIRDNVRKHRYASRDSFEADINQIVDNSILYNGEMSPLTMVAKNMLLMAQKKMQEKTERMSRLEMAINPLLGDDDQLAFSFILDNILTALKLVPESNMPEAMAEGILDCFEGTKCE